MDVTNAFLEDDWEDCTFGKGGEGPLRVRKISSDNCKNILSRRDELSRLKDGWRIFLQATGKLDLHISKYKELMKYLIDIEDFDRLHNFLNNLQPLNWRRSRNGNRCDVGST